MSEKVSFKYCIVPCCKSTTVNTSEKVFFNVPKDPLKRKAWTNAMKRDDKLYATLSSKTTHVCCEDHFSLPEDMENYWQWKLTKDVNRLRLKPDVIPHIFDCQKGKIPAAAKRKKYPCQLTGRRSSENTWEPEENLDCPEIIAEFEKNFSKKEKTASSERKRKADSSDLASKPPAKKKSEEEKLRGFDRNLEPDKIIGATDTAGELMFLIKWKGCDEADLVSSKIANVKCPQVVIKFYEERLIWHSGNSCEDEEGEDKDGKKSSA